MHFVNRLLALAFGIALGLTIFSWVVDQQLLQPTAFIKLVPSSTYSQLALELPATLSRIVELTPSDRAILSQYVDANLTRQLVTSTITEELNYWHGHSTAPTLDLRPLAAQLNQAGAEISPALQDYLFQPQPITNPQLDKVIRPSIQRVDQLRYAGPLAAIVLLVLICLVAGHRRLRYLGEGCVVAALTLGAAILVNLGIPSLVNSALGTSALTSLAAPIKSALTASIHTVNHQLILALLAFVGAAVILFILQPIFGRHHRRH